MASSRPVAFFDFEAMERAKPRYAALFAEEGDAMKDAKCKEEALALLWLFLGEFDMLHCESNFLFEDLNKVTSVWILIFCYKCIDWCVDKFASLMFMKKVAVRLHWLVDGHDSVPNSPPDGPPWDFVQLWFEAPRVEWIQRGWRFFFPKKRDTSLLTRKKNTHTKSSVYDVYVLIYIPGTQMTSIFEGQRPKTRPFQTKTRVIWVPGIYTSESFFCSVFTCLFFFWGGRTRWQGMTMGRLLAVLLGGEILSSGSKLPSIFRTKNLPPTCRDTGGFSGGVWKLSGLDPPKRHKHAAWLWYPWICFCWWLFMDCTMTLYKSPLNKPSSVVDHIFGSRFPSASFTSKSKQVWRLVPSC